MASKNMVIQGENPVQFNIQLSRIKRKFDEIKQKNPNNNLVLNELGNKKISIEIEKFYILIIDLNDQS